MVTDMIPDDNWNSYMKGYGYDRWEDEYVWDDTQGKYVKWSDDYDVPDIDDDDENLLPWC